MPVSGPHGSLHIQQPTAAALPHGRESPVRLGTQHLVWPPDSQNVPSPVWRHLWKQQGQHPQISFSQSWMVSPNCLCFSCLTPNLSHPSFLIKHFGGGYDLTVHPPKTLMLKSNAQCDVIRKWGLWEVLSHKSGAFMKGLCCYKPPESSPATSSTWEWREKAGGPRRGLHQTPNLPAPGTWTPQPPELWETMFNVYKPLR